MQESYSKRIAIMQAAVEEERAEREEAQEEARAELRGLEQRYEEEVKRLSRELASSQEAQQQAASMAAAAAAAAAVSFADGTLGAGGAGGAVVSVYDTGAGDMLDDEEGEIQSRESWAALSAKNSEMQREVVELRKSQVGFGGSRGSF